MPRWLLRIGGDEMAFNNSSYFAGIGTAFAAIAIGFAGGAMLTSSAVQAPNRLERVTAGNVNPGATAASNTAPSNTAATSPASAPANPEQANAAKPAAQDNPAPSTNVTPAPPV